MFSHQLRMCVRNHFWKQTRFISTHYPFRTRITRKHPGCALLSSRSYIKHSDNDTGFITKRSKAYSMLLKASSEKYSTTSIVKLEPDISVLLTEIGLLSRLHFLKQQFERSESINYLSRRLNQKSKTRLI